jgi:hypothetical protein
MLALCLTSLLCATLRAQTSQPSQVVSEDARDFVRTATAELAKRAEQYTSSTRPQWSATVSLLEVRAGKKPVSLNDDPALVALHSAVSAIDLAAVGGHVYRFLLVPLNVQTPNGTCVVEAQWRPVSKPVREYMTRDELEKFGKRTGQPPKGSSMPVRRREDDARDDAIQNTANKRKDSCEIIVIRVEMKAGTVDPKAIRKAKSITVTGTIADFGITANVYSAQHGLYYEQSGPKLTQIAVAAGSVEF